jgi:hypothetical protein
VVLGIAAVERVLVRWPITLVAVMWPPVSPNTLLLRRMQ